MIVGSFAALCCARGAPPGERDASTSAVGSSSAFAIASDTGDGGELEGALSTADASLAVDAPPPPRLASKAQMAWVHTEPRPGSPKLGYLRAGAIVERDEKPSSEEGCSHGWYGIRPRGFVCVGDTATIDLDDEIAKAATHRPDLNAPLPYAYGVARNTLSPFYARIPTHEESARLEADYEDHLARVHRMADAGPEGGPEYDAGVFLDGPPWFLLDKHVVPNVSGLIKSPRALWAGRPRTKEGFAIVASFVSGPGGTPPDGGLDDRRFDLTTDYLLLPHDRMREVRPSTFHGALLNQGEGADATTLPIVFTRPRHHIAKVKLEGGGAEPAMPPRTPVAITGEIKRISGVDWYPTKDGFALKAEDVIRIDAPKSWPAFANKGEKWIEVSIAHQSLVAYEGTKPVYATLVSTGRDGLGDPESTKATIRGVYRIGTKHVTVTMDSDEVGEEFSLRDVPFVQYFETGYALHGAYWHDGFGEPRSHGCINLSEIDAQWLFAWTGPELPEGWHAIMARPLATGTQIWIHV